MIPLGVLSSRRPAAAGGGSPLTFTGHTSTGAEGTVHQLTIPIGVASANRQVVVAVTGQYLYIPSAWTIGGEAVTVDAVSGTASATSTALVRAAIATGETAELKVTTSGSVARVGAGVWVTDSPVSPISAGSGANGAKIDLSTMAGDVVIAAKYGTADVAWTGIIEDYDSIYSAATDRYTGGSIISSGGIVSPRATGGLSSLHVLAVAYRGV